MLNDVKFIGNLTKRVELRRTESGKSVANLDIALNYFIGEEKKTEYVQVVLWEKKAEDAATYLDKGRQVYVEAKVVVRKRNIEGKNIPIPEFHADRVLYLGASNNQNGANDQDNQSGGVSPHEQVFGQSNGFQGNPGFQQQSGSPFGNSNGGNQNPFGR